MTRLLVIDVGNTHTVLGVYEGEKLGAHWRIQTALGRTTDEYGVLFRNLLSGPESADIEGAVISCVVPVMIHTVTELCRKRLDVDPLIVGPGIRTGMPILYDKPQEVGADRIVNAIAAYDKTRDTTIVVDFGTTTVFDYITKQGEYVGGVICPGLGIASQALFDRAAKLYPVEFVRPKQVVGRNTVHAIQSGLMYGHLAMDWWTAWWNASSVRTRCRHTSSPRVDWLRCSQQNRQRSTRSTSSSQWRACDSSTSGIRTRKGAKWQLPKSARYAI